MFATRFFALAVVCWIGVSAPARSAPPARNKPISAASSKPARAADRDSDGLSDYAEIHKYFSDPKKSRTEGQPKPDGDWQTRRAFTYTITAKMRILKPCNPADMNDDYQDARVLSEDKDSYTLEIVYYPLNTNRDAIGANPNWRRDDAGMTDYLEPTPTENWDAKMRTDLLAELKKDGIEPDKMTDKAVVEKVSKWAMRRARHVESFIGWDLYFPNGKPTVYPALQKDFAEQEARFGLSERQLIEQEALGRSMYYGRTHADCTSSATYLTTIFRAIGIPTRIIFTVPAADTNDPKQATLLLGAIHQHQVFDKIRAGLPSGGFSNHVYNEVWIAGRWTRLNYTNLGQNIIDGDYLGLMTHIFTTNDLSKTPLAQTWGSRYRGVGYEYPLSSVNPYQLLSVSDHFGKYARIANPPLPELKTATINALYWRGAPDLPIFLNEQTLAETKTDFFIGVQEYIEGNLRFQHDFCGKAGNRFILRSSGRADVGAMLNGLNVSNGGIKFQAFGATIDAADRDKFVPGADYGIVPVNTSEIYKWVVASGVTLRQTKP